ncbi:MAG: hypothetical protein IT361_18920 [Gemmatimonadaceae bacterium]|nr:hypothetical protein [Gemmatimonadaceae bacterium]
MVRRLLTTCSVALCIGALATPLAAQAPRAGTATLAAPSRAASVAGVSRPSESGFARGTILPQQGLRARGRPVSYMVTGAAAFVGGLLIGDDIGTVIAVGGLGLGVYGLYLYTR